MAPPTPTSIMLVSGEYFDHLAPDSNVITLDVLAAGLRQPRFNAQTTRLITVAEHSMRVRRIARELCTGDAEVDRVAKASYENANAVGVVRTLNTWSSLPEQAREAWRRRVSGSPVAELWALLHDAHEALVSWGDCLRPGKTDEMRKVEATIDGHVLLAIAPAVRTVEVSAVVDVVKRADDIALYFEAMRWGGPGAIDWAPPVMDRVWEDLRGPNEFRSTMVERFMPLVEPRPGECWRAQVEGLLS